MFINFGSLLYIQKHTIPNHEDTKASSKCTVKGNFTMEEDFFAKSRNGHLLKDTFDKEKNTLDIHSNGLYPANVLSNLAKKPFVFEGVECSSIEGFLQSLKTQDAEEQKQICALYGGSAKKISKNHMEWQKTQKLYWQGKEYDRNSKEYRELLENVFFQCYLQNEIFRTALDATKGIKLTHTDGKHDAAETILTAEEFIDILTSIRDREV